MILLLGGEGEGGDVFVGCVVVVDEDEGEGVLVDEVGGGGGGTKDVVQIYSPSLLISSNNTSLSVP